MATPNSTSTITKTVTISPGESFTLPPGAELIYTSDNNGLDTDCPLPPQQALNCYRFSITVDHDNNTSHPMDESDAALDYIQILGTQYPLNFTIDRNVISMYQLLSADIPQGLVKVIYVDRRTFDKRRQFIVTVKALDNIASTVEIRLHGSGYELGAFVKLSIQDDCTLSCPDNHSCYDGVTLEGTGLFDG